MEKALYLNPDLTWAYIYLAEHYIRTKNFWTALEVTHQAIRVNPNIAKTYTLLGRASLFLKDKEKSLSSFKKAVLISPSFNRFNDLGIAYAVFGLNKEAILNFKKALEINPNHAEAAQIKLKLQTLTSKN